MNCTYVFIVHEKMHAVTRNHVWIELENTVLRERLLQATHCHLFSKASISGITLLLLPHEICIVVGSLPVLARKPAWRTEGT